MDSKGFTLLEIIIVLCIIIIFFSFSFPNYTSIMINARRADGQTALLELANRLEIYYAKNFSYREATLGEDNNLNNIMSSFSTQNWYKLKLLSLTDSTFNLAAIPQNSQVNDMKCQTLTLSSEGIKGITSGPIGEPTGTTKECWGN